ncbi:hypothetical protein D3C81_2209350 [compost metagenome]
MVVGDVPMYYYDNQGQPVGENGGSAPGIAIPAPSAAPQEEQQNSGSSTNSKGNSNPSTGSEENGGESRNTGSTAGTE